MAHDFDSKLLLVDSSTETRRLLEVRLRSEEVQLHAATSGEEALDVAPQLMPDLILLDLNTPDMDGFRVLRALKGDPETVDIPVIVCSQQDDTEIKIRALDLGAIDFVGKPFNFPELRARVRSAIRISHLMRLLSLRAQIDGLTGLWNRTYFDERIASELSASERSGAPLSIAMVDLDDFKELNDTYGHAAGDAVLQGAARILVGNLRGSDVACRYGGEELGLVLRETSAEEAASLMHRIRRALAEMEWPRHPERRVTASFGVAQSAPADLSNPDKQHAARAMIERADDALYEAKEAGRNSVAIADQGPDEQPAARLAPTG